MARQLAPAPLYDLARGLAAARLSDTPGKSAGLIVPEMLGYFLIDAAVAQDPDLPLEY